MRRRAIRILIGATTLLIVYMLLKLGDRNHCLNLDLDYIHAVGSLKDSIDVYKELANKPVNKSRSDLETVHSSEIEHNCLETVPDNSYRHHYCPLYEILNKPKQICTNDTDLFITIITSADNIQSRKALRETILSPLIGESRIKYVFVVGRSSSSSQQQLSNEIERNDDIVIGNFIDHYANLTIKSLFMLKLAVAHCPSARFVMKLDDDVFVNIAGIYEQLSNKPYHHAIYGYVLDGVRPIHDPHHKWFAENYPALFFPRYVGGPMYIFSSDLAAPLYSVAMTQPFVRLEDAFLTGICAQHLNMDDLRYICVRDFHPDVNVNGISVLNSDNFLAAHSMTFAQIHSLWKKLVET